jgi:hypothetical protein
MKVSLAALAVILSSLVSAHAITTSTQAFNYFTDANGNVGFIDALRQTDPTTNITTTTMSYSFCVQTTAASCLEGSGTIPNDAFAGHLTSNINLAEVLNLLVDTTKWGFVNQLCNGPDPFGGCTQGTSPATGGVIFVHYVKKLGTIQILTSTNFEETSYKITLDSVDATNQFTATATGHIFGTNVSDKLAYAAFETLTGKGTPGGQSQAALNKSLDPKTVRRLERLKKLVAR